MKQLEEIKARASAAAIGPWRWDENFGDKGDEGTALTNDIGTEIIGAYNFHCCSYRDEPTVDESSAPFIAAARTDVPKLVAALEAVASVHQQRGDQYCKTCSHCIRPSGFSNRGEQPVRWPCPTIAAIIDALELA